MHRSIRFQTLDSRNQISSARRFPLPGLASESAESPCNSCEDEQISPKSSQSAGKVEELGHQCRHFGTTGSTEPVHVLRTTILIGACTRCRASAPPSQRGESRWVRAHRSHCQSRKSLFDRWKRNGAKGCGMRFPRKRSTPQGLRHQAESCLSRFSLAGILI